MNLSVVSTLYYSAPYIEEFYSRICQSVESCGLSFEIIFVNDGSPDDSIEIVLKLREKDTRVCLIDLSRNFGHHKAIMTGLSFAQGDLVFLIDVDLEESPELLETFYAKMQTTRADVVYGIREKREDKGLNKLFALLSWKILNWLTDFQIPANQLTARLMTRKYLYNVLEHKEREVYMAGLFALMGFTQIPVVVGKSYKGVSTYTFKKKMAQMIDSITAFSNKPLFIIFNLGIFIAFISACAGIYLIIRRVFFDDLLLGWPSLMVAIWFLGGLTLFALGTIGIYLAKTYNEVKQRPLTIVRAIYKGESSATGSGPSSSELVNTRRS